MKYRTSHTGNGSSKRHHREAAGDREAVRVCFVIDNLSRAGTEMQVLLLLDQLDRRNVLPYLCLLDGRNEASEVLAPPGVMTSRLGVRRLKSWHAMRQAWKFWHFLRRERIDVVQTYFADSTWFAAPIAKMAGVRAVFGSRRNIGHWMTKRDVRVARFYNRNFIDRIIVNCQAAKRAVIEQENAKPDNVIVLPNGIDLDSFKEIEPWRPPSANKPYKVGMVGNLRAIKGPDLFIGAAQRVLQEHPKTQFEIAGGGETGSYQELIDRLGVSRNVRLLGSVRDIPAFLSSLDVAVLPSRAEGLSNALLEYMATGRPIVATNVGGNGELLKTGVNGLLVEPDEAVIATGISRLLREPSLAMELAHAAFSDSRRYGVPHLTTQVEQLLQGAVQRKSGGRYAHVERTRHA